jgi:hypothetical protein
VGGPKMQKERAKGTYVKTNLYLKLQPYLCHDLNNNMITKNRSKFIFINNKHKKQQQQ